MISKV